MAECLLALAVFLNTHKSDYIRSIHTYHQNGQVNSIQQEFLLSPGAYSYIGEPVICSAYLPAAPSLLLNLKPLMQILRKAQESDGWKCIIEFSIACPRESILSNKQFMPSRNAELRSIPTLARDLAVVEAACAHTASCLFEYACDGLFGSPLQSDMWQKCALDLDLVSPRLDSKCCFGFDDSSSTSERLSAEFCSVESMITGWQSSSGFSINTENCQVDNADVSTLSSYRHWGAVNEEYIQLPSSCNGASAMLQLESPNCFARDRRAQQTHRDKESIQGRQDERGARDRIMEITLHKLSQYFHMPITQASNELKVGLTVLKKKCREFGIPRWPHRKMKSLDSLINNIQDLVDESGARSSRRMLNVVTELQEQKRLMEESPGTELAERTKRLRQACFKAGYKKRRLQAQQKPRQN